MTASFFEFFQHITLPMAAVGYLAVLSVAVSKSGFGGGIGSLAAPILLFVLPPKLALAVLLPIFLLIDIWVIAT